MAMPAKYDKAAWEAAGKPWGSPVGSRSGTPKPLPAKFDKAAWEAGGKKFGIGLPPSKQERRVAKKRAPRLTIQ